MNLVKRPRRLRTNDAIRSLVQETILTPSDFLVPLFIIEGIGTMKEIPSMPNYYKKSLDLTIQEVRELWAMGIKSILLFVQVPDKLKDNYGKEALNKNGLMQRSIRSIKEAVPEMIIMTDVALDPYSSYGHDGIVENGQILNDATVDILTEMSISHAQSGADFLAPSDMMDGRIMGIRKGLDQNGFTNNGIMSYSAKYASSFYGPFRDALDSSPGFGDKKTYQMNPANSLEAIKEIVLDIEEGADMIMVKPGMPYLDIVKGAKEISEVPVAVYQVSGEYAIIKAGAEKGWIDENAAIIESLTSIKRAGADVIATYFAKEAIKLFGY